MGGSVRAVGLSRITLRVLEIVDACAAGQDGYAATKAMKTRMLLATSLLLAFFAGAADNSRTVTVTATHDGPATVQIQKGETAELMSSVSTTKNGTVQITVLKGGAESGPWGFGIPLTGPATIAAIVAK